MELKWTKRFFKRPRGHAFGGDPHVATKLHENIGGKIFIVVINQYL